MGGGTTENFFSRKGLRNFFKISEFLQFLTTPRQTLCEMKQAWESRTLFTQHGQLMPVAWATVQKEFCKTNGSNAFNTTSRTCLLKHCLIDFREVFRWAQ